MGRRLLSFRHLIYRRWFLCCVISVTCTIVYLLAYQTPSLHSHGTYKEVAGTNWNHLDHNRYRNVGIIDRPHLVMGILTADRNIDLRNAQRSTWISIMLLHQNQLPFKITYKFLLDRPTSNAIAENNIYHDIVFLNATGHGRAVKFGEKLYLWIKYIHENYPDASLGAKMDDDVFLCVPQIFERLDQLKSAKLYYGWKHGLGTHVNRDSRIDELFLVVGKDLIERIAKRNYCIGRRCNASKDLIDTNYGGTSMGSWLSIYNDIDLKPDNKRIMNHYSKTISQKLQPDFCLKYFLSHKSDPELMKRIHEYNKQGGYSLQDGYIGAVTGSLFSGEVVRTLLPQSLTITQKYLATLDTIPACDNWAVVTTIFSPSKAVKHIVSLSQWCIVITADRNTPPKESYFREIGLNNQTSKRIKYLSLEEQSILYPLLSEIIPAKHFGRKNIGYIYAMHHKAKLIWDFDDDNLGTFDIQDFKSGVDLPHVKVCNDLPMTLLNPYPYFGVNESYTWPRGFPLQHIKTKRTSPTLCKSSDSFQLGIVQTLANQQPDVDAIYRMTRDAPFNFSATKSSHPPLVLPKDAFAPFNAQATLWLASAFPYMALPLSVNGRVSDIWRSYIAEYYLHRKNIRVAFYPPCVIQERNVHNTLRDFNAEIDLYQKSEQLVDFLSHQRFSTELDLVEMYRSLYSRKYIEGLDIQFAEAWVKTLASINSVA